MIEGGRLWLRGDGFPQPESTSDLVTIGGVPARMAFAAGDRMAVVVPGGLDGGETPVKCAWLPGATLYARVGRLLATGLHQVDNPVFDAAGNLFVTYSGSRGQEAAVSIFRVTPKGAREPFVHGLVNPTSMALGPDGLLYVSSRFEGRVYRVFDDGRYEVMASDLGVACGLAFDADGVLFVGDRSGTVFRIDRKGRTETFASVPSSIAAFHLAMSPDGELYVSAPTLASYDSLFRIDSEGRVETLTCAVRPPARARIRCGRRAARRRSARRLERRVCAAAPIAIRSWWWPAPAWWGWPSARAASWSSRRTARSIRSPPQ